MISIWHLLWIVPLSASVGFVYCALVAPAGTKDVDYKKRDVM